MKPVFMIMALAVALAACDRDEPPVERQAPEGRAETQSIRNVGAIGTDGAAIADQVDATLDANDRRVRETEEASAE